MSIASNVTTDGRHGSACDAKRRATRTTDQAESAPVVEEFEDLTVRAGNPVRLLRSAKRAPTECNATGRHLGNATLHGNVAPIDGDAERLVLDNGL